MRFTNEQRKKAVPIAQMKRGVAKTVAVNNLASELGLTQQQVNGLVYRVGQTALKSVKSTVAKHSDIVVDTENRIITGMIKTDDVVKFGFNPKTGKFSIKY